MKILDFNDGKVIISPEILSISPFKELWDKDKSKDKELATKQLKYIWFYSDYNSPYFKYSEEERHTLILKDVLNDNKFNTKEIKKELEKYRELTISPAVDAVDAAFSFIRNLQNYLKRIDLTQVDAKKVSDIFINMPKIINSLQEAKKAAEIDSTAKIKVRGNASVGLFED